MSVPVASRERRPRRWAVPAAVVWAVVAGAGAIAVVQVRAGAPFAALGVSEPGLAIEVSVVLVRIVVLIAGGISTGAALAAVVVSPTRGGARELSAPAWACARLAGGAGAVWAVSASAAVPLTVISATGGDVSVLGESGFAAAMGALEEPAGFLVAALAASVVAVACRVTFSWRAVLGVLPLAALAIAAPVVTGFPASIGGDHDVVSDLAVLAALASATGLGVAVASARYGPRRGLDAAWAAARERWALRVTTALAVTTTLLADVWLVGGAWTGRYGLLSAVQVVLLLAATAAGFGLTPPRSRRPIVIGGFASAAVLAALLATDVPAGLPGRTTAQQSLLGFDLSGPVSAARLLGPGRVDVLVDFAVLLLAVMYLAGARRVRRRGGTWPGGRTAAWLAGCGLLAWTVSSGTGEYAMAMFSVHMVLHMLLSMLVPVLLALGAPITLARDALPAAACDGPREWMLSIAESPLLRTLSHPLVSLILFVGSFYALYFSSAFAAALPYHWAHQLMYLMFVLVGYFFFWPLVGRDPAPLALPHIARLGLLLAAMPFHVLFGVILSDGADVIGERFYADLALAWAPDLLAEQKLGAAVALIGGEAPLLLALVALLVQWSRHDRDPGTHPNAWERQGPETLLDELAERHRAP